MQISVLTLNMVGVDTDVSAPINRMSHSSFFHPFQVTPTPIVRKETPTIPFHLLIAQFQYTASTELLNISQWEPALLTRLECLGIASFPFSFTDTTWLTVTQIRPLLPCSSQ